MDRRPASRLALLGSTAIVLCGLFAFPAFAIDECGTGTEVICDSDDPNYPTFPNGIIYGPVADLTLVVDEGATIITSGSNTDGIFIGSTGGDIDVTLQDGSSITTSGARGILLIDADSDASNGEAFALAHSVFGAYQYELTYDPNLFDWSLESLGIHPGTAEYPALVSGALLAFASDLPALYDRLRESFGDGKERIEPAAWSGPSSGLRPWIQLTGAHHKIETDASYDLGVTSIQAGLDMVRGKASGLYALGSFLGFGLAEQDFSGSASEAETDRLQVGLYGAYRKGALYGQGLFKYEHHRAELQSVATAYDSSPYDVDLLGLSFEGGYRIELDPVYLEPRARLSYAHAWAGNFKDASGAAIDLLDADSVMGELAARMGLSSLYVDLALRHEFSGRTSAEVSGLTFSDQLPGTMVRLASGLDWSLVDGRIDLSLGAAYARGSDAEELSATAALRLIY